MTSTIQDIRQPVALGLQYLGTGFHGFQTQLNPTVATIQQSLEEALTQIANHPVRLVACSGRTDTGVHAAAQVVHFIARTERPISAWVRGVNSVLPPGIRVCWAKHVSDDFHARHSATARAYQYCLDLSQHEHIFTKDWTVWHPKPLNIEAMQQAANDLVGTHDFTSIRAAGCQSGSPVRTITCCQFRRKGALLVLDIHGNGFLYHMVRNIVGTLLLVGLNEKPAHWIPELLALKDRSLAGDTAPARGLCLVEVEYPDHFDLPQGWSRPPAGIASS